MRVLVGVSLRSRQIAAGRRSENRTNKIMRAEPKLRPLREFFFFGGTGPRSFFFAVLYAFFLTAAATTESTAAAMVQRKVRM